VNFEHNAAKSSKITASSKSKKVTDYNLPHTRPCKELYEVTMKEKEFIEQRENLLVTSSGIEGLYETQTPLSLDAVVKLGNMARVPISKRDSIGTNTKKFDLGDLEKVAKPSIQYVRARGETESAPTNPPLSSGTCTARCPRPSASSCCTGAPPRAAASWPSSSWTAWATPGRSAARPRTP
jgi:hypothetical protein